LSGYWSLPAGRSRVPVGVAFCDQTFTNPAITTLDLGGWSGAPSISAQFSMLETWSTCRTTDGTEVFVAENNQYLGMKSFGFANMMYPTSLGACGTDTESKALNGPTISLIRIGNITNILIARPLLTIPF
jgi:hypothetical protein